MSSLPNSEAAFPIAGVICSVRETSICRGKQWRPSFSISRTSSPPVPTSRNPNAISAPACARASEIARPRPRAAPVTRAALPCRSNRGKSFMPRDYIIALQTLTLGETLAYNDLREWIAPPERAGELKRIRTEVDPVLEIAEITDRVSKGRDSQGRTGGPALLFENPKGSKVPVLINQFGSERRMRMALEVDSLDEVADRIRQFMEVKSPQGLLDKIKM